MPAPVLVSTYSPTARLTTAPPVGTVQMNSAMPWNIDRATGNYASNTRSSAVPMTSPYMQGRYNQITRKPIDATPLAFAPAPRSPMDPRPTAPYAQMSIPTMPTRSPYAPRMPQGSPGKVVPWQQPTGMWRFPPQKSTPAIPTPPWVTKPRIIYRGGRKYTIVPLSFWHRLFGGKRWRTYADNGQVVDTSFDPGTALDAPAGVFAEVGGASAATDAAADVPEETPTIFGVNRNYVIAGAIGVLILGGGGAAFAFSKKGA